MNPNASPARLAVLLTAFVLTAALWSSTAAAQTQHPLSGNMRYQIGNGLPIPISFGAVPNGAIDAIEDAVVTQQPGGTITLQPGQFTHPGTPMAIPVFGANNNIFQVNTAIPVQFPAPGPAAVFAPSGRTGANTVTFCAGQTVTAMGNPGCIGPAVGNAVGVNGLMKYTRTAGQLGGPGSARLTGTAGLYLNGNGLTSGNLPCNSGTQTACQVVLGKATPAGTAGQGLPFGATVGTPGSAPNPGKFNASIAGNGLVLSFTTVGVGAGATNKATSYGGPWTAGTLTVSVTANAGAPEVFVLTGSDVRQGTGQGSVSLVSGSVSNRQVTGPNANRGWLNMSIKPPFGVVPAMTTPGLAAAIGLLALAGAYIVRKRLS